MAPSGASTTSAADTRSGWTSELSTAASTSMVLRIAARPVQLEREAS
jgi:hypothetical protein